MKTPERANVVWFLGDRAWWLALAAGPICWLTLHLSGMSLREQTLPFQTLFMAAVLGPVLEEIVFRGGVQALLQHWHKTRRKVFGISLANGVTSVVFALMHLLNQPPAWAALVFFPSLVFGWAKERHETLLSPIGLHVVYNAGFLWLFA